QPRPERRQEAVIVEDRIDLPKLRRQLPQLRRQHRLPQTLASRTLPQHHAPPNVAIPNDARTATGRTWPTRTDYFRGKYARTGPAPGRRQAPLHPRAALAPPAAERSTAATWSSPSLRRATSASSTFGRRSS